MKSKGEILAKHNLAQNNTWLLSTVNRMHDAMDEYGKDVVVEFEKWKCRYGIAPCADFANIGCLQDGVGNVFTVEALFNLFLQEK